MAEKLLTVAIQYGLPTILLFVLAWAYDRQTRKHDAERTEWNKEWNKERARLYESWRDESGKRVEDAERYAAGIARSQEVQLSIVNKTNEMIAQAEKREKEIREEKRELERELRKTGDYGQGPWGSKATGPGKGGGGRGT